MAALPTVLTVYKHKNSSVAWGGGATAHHWSKEKRGENHAFSAPTRFVSSGTGV